MGHGEEHLDRAWVTTAAAAGARGDVAAVGARLLAAWTEPHRGYHDLRHLTEVLRRVDELAGPGRLDAAGATAVRLAAWFHDAVYDPRATDNEDASARRADQDLAALQVPPGVRTEVARLVRLTASHDPSPDDLRGAVLCDADLGVLAAPAQRYAGYVQGVRREYAHLPDATFRAGRAAVLRRLLERPRLYSSPGATGWEEPARAAVTAELRALSGPGAGAALPR